MGYDIPDEIKYREKIVANLDLRQLGYAILFGLLAFFSYNLPLSGDVRLIAPAILSMLGFGFIFFGLEERLLSHVSYYLNLRKAGSHSLEAQKFFGVKEVKNDLVWLDNGDKIGVFKVNAINFSLLDSARKKVLLANYKAFLNQLSFPVQILVKTIPVSLQDYFEDIEKAKTRGEMAEFYADFRQFEEGLMDKGNVKKREYYLIARFYKDKGIADIETQITILEENILACGLLCDRLEDLDLIEFLVGYGGERAEAGISNSKDEFRDMLTPSFAFYPTYGLVNGEYHRVVQVVGYPRKVEDGWLQAFLCKNEDYDISMHLEPASINHTLVYLHNQIVQQTSDLLMSTAKGTPNPSLEIKKADTMRIYESLYKGEEKMFRVSVYIDNKAENNGGLSLITEKCTSSLNSLMMVPEKVGWRTADAIKTTLPIADNKLGKTREILTGALAATFPFISANSSSEKGILFAHEAQTLNPIFLDLENQSNKHFFIIGISGSGKSYAAKYLAIQQLFKEEGHLYVLDPNGEYSGLCDALGGDVIEISRDSKNIINLFDLCGEDFGGKMLQLISAFDIVMGGLNESQKAILSDAISNAYARKGIKANKEETWSRSPPRFSDLKSTLEEMSKQVNQMSPQGRSLDALYRRVKMYCEGGVFGFLDQDTKIRSDNPVLCFDLSKLPSAVKPLMIFMVLGFIQRQISKNKESKTVLIDEGWVLLRSKEAEHYILEFVKTSRKFNASIGFITQEVEDLLQSSAGKSILNTASVKILMRQSASGISLVSNNLRLNEYEENYLLSAKKGHGLVITEDNSYCFVIEASPKIHALITTNPNEKSQETKKKAKEDVKVNLERGLYAKNELTDAQVVKLLSNGYRLYRTRITADDKNLYYLVKVRQNETALHAFLCWYTLSLISEKGLKCKVSPTSDPDIEVIVGKKNYCFEIETGTRLDKLKRGELMTRFAEESGRVDGVYVVVPNKRVARSYQNLCKNIITQADLQAAIDRFTHSLSN